MVWLSEHFPQKSFNLFSTESFIPLYFSFSRIFSPSSSCCYRIFSYSSSHSLSLKSSLHFSARDLFHYVYYYRKSHFLSVLSLYRFAIHLTNSFSSLLPSTLVCLSAAIYLVPISFHTFLLSIISLCMIQCSTFPLFYILAPGHSPHSFISHATSLLIAPPPLPPPYE